MHGGHCCTNSDYQYGYMYTSSKLHSPHLFHHHIWSKAVTDYVSLNPMLTFDVGASDGSSECRNIPIQDDNIAESTEDFSISLTSVDSVEFENSVGTVLILDDDGRWKFVCMEILLSRTCVIKITLWCLLIYRGVCVSHEHRSQHHRRGQWINANCSCVCHTRQYHGRFRP